MFWTVRDGRKISTDHKYKIGVEVSNGDVISAAGRQLAAKTICSPNLTVWKSQMTCKQD
jgi:hypothetical protein